MSWLYYKLRQIYRKLLFWRQTAFKSSLSFLEKSASYPKLALISNQRVRQYVRQVLAIPGRSSLYVEEESASYIRQEQDPLLLAYYLPQYHPIPENDEWWGRGVTEWSNVSRAVPQFLGHYQPRLPGELGYYDLRIPDNIARQVELAKKHGIYGFAYYYYWFDGKRLLEKPLNIFLEHSEIDFPFCLCWANESWTRRFDGNSGEILIEQNKNIDSYIAFVNGLIPYMKDARYIRLSDRPLLIVYRPSHIPNCRDVIKIWRARLEAAGVGNPYIVGVKEHGVETDLLNLGFDAQSEFHPGTVFKDCKNITREIEYLREDFTGSVFDYSDLVKNKKYLNVQSRKLYRAVMPMWDNTPRRNNSPMVFHGSTPDLYQEWLMDTISETRKKEDLDAPLIFINAWNEWGESAYLEPDRKYGYAYLRATRCAIEQSRNRP